MEFLVTHALHAGQDKTRPQLEPFKAAVVLLDKRGIVSGIGIGQYAGTQVQDAHIGGNKQTFAVVFAKLLIGPGEDLRRGQAGLRLVADDGLGNDHEQRRRNALTGYVGNDDRQVGLVDHKEIVEVAADLLGRVHGGVYIKFRTLRESREDVRQHIALDVAGDIEFGFGLEGAGGPERRREDLIIQDNEYRTDNQVENDEVETHVRHTGQDAQGIGQAVDDRKRHIAVYRNRHIVFQLCAEHFDNLLQGVAHQAPIGKIEDRKPENLDAQENCDRADIVGIRRVVDQAERRAAEEEGRYIGNQGAHNGRKHTRRPLVGVEHNGRDRGEDQRTQEIDIIVRNVDGIAGDANEQMQNGKADPSQKGLGSPLASGQGAVGEQCSDPERKVVCQRP